MSLAAEFRDSVSRGLLRKSLVSPSRWAVMYRKGIKNTVWSFQRHPWAREMHDSKAEYNVGQKGAQMAYTETLLSVGFYHNDILKEDVLYVLPRDADASDFSKARFDAAVSVSRHLRDLYRDSNVGHKRAGANNFYIRGSQSRAGLKSIPVAVVILDELDEMDQEKVPLARERTSGQDEKLIWEVSTPTLNNHGINKSFLESDQSHFFFRCPNCSVLTELTFPECLVIIGDDPDGIEIKQSHLICKECTSVLPHESKSSWLSTGRWISTVANKEKKGFWISQLYSPTVSPANLASAYLRAQTNPADEQEFWNSKMGLPHEVEGARIQDQLIDNCIGNFCNNAPYQADAITIGVDVGKFLHYEVTAWILGNNVGNDINANATAKVVEFGKVRSFEQLDQLMEKHRPNAVVVDAHPERREAFKFSQRFWGRVWMCIYGRGVSGKQVHEHKSDVGEPLLTVDRTSWLDQSLGRFKVQSIQLPRDISFEYRDHLKSLARIWRKDPDGNPVGSYVTEASRADHYAHARTYAEIALALATTTGQNYDVAIPI